MANEVKITIYDTTTGQIKRNVSCDSTMVTIQLLENEDYISDFYDSEDYYVPSGVLTARPAAPTISTLSITANGTQTANISSVPTSAELSIVTPPECENIADVITDGSVALSSVIEGTHNVFIQKFPYKELEAVVTVVPVGSSGADLKSFFSSGSMNAVSNMAQAFSLYSFTQTPETLSTLSNDNQRVSLYSFTQTPETLSTELNYAQLFSSGYFAQTENEIELGENLVQLINLYSFDSNINDCGVISNDAQLFSVGTFSTQINSVEVGSNSSQLFVLGEYTTDNAEPSFETNLSQLFPAITFTLSADEITI
jgi:hypothetical protein